MQVAWIIEGTTVILIIAVAVTVALLCPGDNEIDYRPYQKRQNNFDY